MAEAPIGEPSTKFHPFFTKGFAASSPLTGDTYPSEESNLEDGPRKRRKSDVDVAQENSTVKRKRGRPRKDTSSSITKIEEPNAPALPLIEQPQMPVLQDKPAQSTEDSPQNVAPETPTVPKKVLKFNPKTGTFGSPPKPKSVPIPTRIVTIKYGPDEEKRKALGVKIAQILEGTLQLPFTPKPASKKTKPTTTAKPTHPFFGGKPKPDPSNSSRKQINKQSVFMSTPVSPQKPRAVPWSKAPQFSAKSSGIKVHGAMHPMWPPKDMCHVRDVKPSCVAQAHVPTKKSKGQAVVVTKADSVLTHLLDGLSLDDIRESIPRDEDKFTPAPSQLRLPQRHFESGRKLQARIRPQLKTYRAGLGFDESAEFDDLAGSPEHNHAAIQRLYDSLTTQLSAYDRSDCESMAWVQKYAPVTAAQVLQAGKEGFLLKRWLQALKVDSVHTGSPVLKAKGKAEGVAKKKRKKNKLEGFIVDSEEEANEMVGSDEDDYIPIGPGQNTNSVIRSGDLGGRSREIRRPTNMVLLSGPSGSGKTAAVFAVAKELGYEVFEINSSSRRSGKDILERVGDMTRNHLVQHHQTGSTEGDDQVAKDLKSGKQGTMASFFKSKNPTTKTPQPKAVGEDSPKSTVPRSQKQSLILLEEVDVLFEEDKQFWTTLLGMVAQSKRPFVMTCNDEKMIPFQTMMLHGIFRFSPPPTDLAVDACLLIAANEGHALQRSAVETLYESRGNDLRATITELNYWCQIGVGDRRGGFDWFYLRWPKGSDLDENGDVVRVISEGTYCRGMGWFGRDQMVSNADGQEKEEEAMRQAWDSWRLDMGNWETCAELSSWASALPKDPQRESALEALAAYDDYCGAMSEADLCSVGSLASKLQETMDSTLPDIPDKTRSDYIIGQSLLEADPVTRHTSPERAMTTSMKSLAKARLHELGTRLGTSNQALQRIDEDKAVGVLQRWFQDEETQLIRYDIALAFDPIAVSAKATPATYLDPSVFDQTMRLIVLDVAPWVRGIVAYDNKLMAERLRLSNLLSEGGKRKRMRTTRAAYSALEGGERSTTRRERYFGDVLNTGFVMRTGGSTWQDAIAEPVREAASVPSSPKSDETE
ncbi:hypothetical protein B0I35DRAFT_483319 [Stachybotrys elegans]|uniref:AAA+ ATPase domain-containing protein n=1 Tax=Stachybotrys elegans TaxID=80388 RepID=A0A8K0SFL8_9HYPO|nr:hypothetical protein B0I35DRAFT_483319 [Stachybotrys elegans]